MKVFVCSTGVCNEGGAAAKVFDAEDKAKKWVEETERALRSHEYAEYDEFEVE